MQMGKDVHSAYGLNGVFFLLYDGNHILSIRKGEMMMKREGEIRIPSGCAIAAVISKEGKGITGDLISEAMKPMHDRSNGLGGGFAAYGIYPEHKEFFAFHIFFDHRSTRKECEALLKERFEIVKGEIIPTRKQNRKPKSDDFNHNSSSAMNESVNTPCVSSDEKDQIIKDLRAEIDRLTSEKLSLAVQLEEMAKQLRN